MHNSTRIESLRLDPQQREALRLAKIKLSELFPVRELIVFGSVARETATSDSDLDLLVVTERLMSHQERGQMSDVLFDINLDYDTNISLVVVDASSWYGGILSLTQLHDEVERDGVLV